MSVLLDSEDMLWVGTMTGGLNRINTDTASNTVFLHDANDPTSLSANGIMALLEDSTGDIWAGTFGGGISRFDRGAGHFVHYAADPSNVEALTSSRVTSFAEDQLGNIWVGTDAGGLNLIDSESGKFHNFRYDEDEPRSLADDTVYALHVDVDGTVWVGTRGGGLSRVVGDSSNPDLVEFTHVTQKDGLANDVVYGIQSDASGELWLSTNYGISRLDQTTGTISNLHRRDGLQSEEFNFGAHHRSADGTMFFGGPNGFNEFEPEQLLSSSVIPPVILTGFFKGNDSARSDIPFDTEEGIDLSYQDDNVSFEFAALDFASPGDNLYKYKLDGRDSDWIALGNHRRITYTDLDKGDYLLRVKAANSDGVWNDVGISLPIRVSPAPWETWWAYLGYAAMAAQLAFLMWSLHARKVRREEEYSYRLEQEVKIRTEELAERNNELNELNVTLQESSLSDPLTGLRNRRFVFEEVSRDLATISRKYTDEREGRNSQNASDLVFMMIDLDNFKPINDTYGHAAGDKILLDIRDVLLSTCRRSDFVVRWGGDEFVVIAKQSQPGESEALAERIRREIESREFSLPDGQFVRTTCSIGFTAFPLFRGQAENGDLDQVINLADNLMYEAKNQRNAWVGMLDINEVVASEGFVTDDIEATSVLFRARHEGRLLEYNPNVNETTVHDISQFVGGLSA
jgi:diguanylate cyclase (GGDEF)-like protein